VPLRQRPAEEVRDPPGERGDQGEDDGHGPNLENRIYSDDMQDGIGGELDRNLSGNINGGIDRVAGQVDGQTSQVAQRAARVLALAVRLLRWPTLALLCAPIPFELVLLELSLSANGWVRVLGLIVTALLAAVTVTFGVRRHRILRAVAEPSALGTELGIAVSLSERVDDARDVLGEVVGGGGRQVFRRLRGLWHGISITGRWIEEVGDLPRARYFVPPKIGTTVALTWAAAWIIPVSIGVTVVAVIGLIADNVTG